MALQANNRNGSRMMLRNDRNMPAWVTEQSGRIGPKPPPPPSTPENGQASMVQPQLPPKVKSQPEPDYEVIEFSNQQYSNSPLRPNSSLSGSKTPDSKLKCTLCGSNVPWVTCEECAQQIFCASCDDMYHKHPKRKNHQRKTLEQSTPPLPPKVLPGQPGPAAPVAPPRRKPRGMMTPLLQRKDQVNGNSAAFAVPPSPSPSLRNAAWHNGDDTLKRGLSMFNRPLPETPKTSTTPSESSRCGTPKSPFDNIQKTPSVVLEKIKNKANATLDRMQLLQQRYRQQKEQMERDRSGSALDQLARQHHQMAAQRANQLGQRGMSTSVFNLNQVHRKPPVASNGWMNNNMQQAQSVAHLNCVNCNHAPHWGGCPQHVHMPQQDPWSNRLNSQQHLNHSNLSLNIGPGYMLQHPHNGMYPPPVFMNQHPGMGQMYPQPYMGGMPIMNPGLTGMPPSASRAASRAGSRMASPAMSRKSVTLRRKQRSNYREDEGTDDEDSDEDDRRSTVSNRSGMSRTRQRRLSSASQMQVDEDLDAAATKLRSRIRNSQRRDSVAKSVHNDWAPGRKNSAGNNRSVDSGFNSPLKPSRIYSDLDSEGSGTRALVQAKIEQKLKEETLKQQKEKKGKRRSESPKQKITSSVQTPTTHAKVDKQKDMEKVKVQQNSSSPSESEEEYEIVEEEVTDDNSEAKEEMASNTKPLTNGTTSEQLTVPTEDEDAVSLGPPPSTPDHEWECEFCTFVNEANIKICTICCKTPSKPPKTVGKSSSPPKQTESTTIVTNSEQSDTVEDIWATLDEDIQTTAHEVTRKAETAKKTTKVSTGCGTSSKSASVERQDVEVRKSQAREIGTSPPPQTISTQDNDLLKYTTEELNAALKYCGPDMHPLIWLRDNWPKLIQTVQSLATKYGQERAENTIGTISQMEAREALRLHTGNIWQAVSECIEQRQRKYREISSKGNFSREDVVTALTTHQGNVELALMDLGRTQLKPFLMRIWGSPGGVENESGAMIMPPSSQSSPTTPYTMDKDIHNFLSANASECMQLPTAAGAFTPNPTNQMPSPYDLPATFTHAYDMNNTMPDNTSSYSADSKDFAPSPPPIDDAVLNNNKSMLKDLESLIGTMEQNQQKQNEQVLRSIQDMISNMKQDKPEDEYDPEMMRILTKSPITSPKVKNISNDKSSQNEEDVKSFVWQHIQEIVPNLVQQVEMELRDDTGVSNVKAQVESQAERESETEAAKNLPPPPPPIDQDEFLMEEVIKPNLKNASIREELPPQYSYTAEIATFQMTFDKALSKQHVQEFELDSLKDAEKQVFKIFTAPVGPVQPLEKTSHELTDNVPDSNNTNLPKPEPSLSSQSSNIPLTIDDAGRQTPPELPPSGVGITAVQLSTEEVTLDTVSNQTHLNFVSQNDEANVDTNFPAEEINNESQLPTPIESFATDHEKEQDISSAQGEVSSSNLNVETINSSPTENAEHNIDTVLIPKVDDVQLEHISGTSISAEAASHVVASEVIKLEDSHSLAITATHTEQSTESTGSEVQPAAEDKENEKTLNLTSESVPSKEPSLDPSTSAITSSATEASSDQPSTSNKIQNNDNQSAVNSHNSTQKRISKIPVRRTSSNKSLVLPLKPLAKAENNQEVAQEIVIPSENISIKQDKEENNESATNGAPGDDSEEEELYSLASSTSTDFEAHSKGIQLPTSTNEVFLMIDQDVGESTMDESTIVPSTSNSTVHSATSFSSGFKSPIEFVHSGDPSKQNLSELVMDTQRLIKQMREEINIDDFESSTDEDYTEEYSDEYEGEEEEDDEDEDEEDFEEEEDEDDWDDEDANFDDVMDNLTADADLGEEQINTLDESQTLDTEEHREENNTSVLSFASVSSKHSQSLISHPMDDTISVSLSPSQSKSNLNQESMNFVESENQIPELPVERIQPEAEPTDPMINLAFVESENALPDLETETVLVQNLEITSSTSAVVPDASPVRDSNTFVSPSIPLSLTNLLETENSLPELPTETVNVPASVEILPIQTENIIPELPTEMTLLNEELKPIPTPLETNSLSEPSKEGDSVHEIVIDTGELPTTSSAAASLSESKTKPIKKGSSIAKLKKTKSVEDENKPSAMKANKNKTASSNEPANKKVTAASKIPKPKDVPAVQKQKPNTNTANRPHEEKPKESPVNKQTKEPKPRIPTRSKSFSGPPIGITSVKTITQRFLNHTKNQTNTAPAPKAPISVARKPSITEAINRLTKPSTSTELPSTSSLFRVRAQPRIPKKKYHETCFSDDDYGTTTSEEEQEPLEIRQRKMSIPVFRAYPIVQEPEEVNAEELAEKFMKEELVRTVAEAQIAATLVSMKFQQDVSIWAAKECSDLEHAIALLKQECELCSGTYALNEIVSMLKCTHKCCKQCAKTYFTVQITERSINDCNCPFCKLPELTNPNEHEDENLEYFSNLDIYLKNIVEPEVHELFQRKLRDRTLLKDPNFKWCVQCSSGFFARPKQKRLICPDCGSVTCASCRKPWQKQHEGISCEKFLEWEMGNDPEVQALGVKEHLEQNGIDCPKCKFKYSLARGGCMHFTCTQCKYEFCYGCAKPFMMGAKCSISPYCAKLGLHAHHPRNCLFYLRDKLPVQLQILLKNNAVEFEVDPIETDNDNEPGTSQKQPSLCPIPIQKETPTGLVDTKCNADVPEKHAGMCRTHYVEYLTAKVAKAKIDPLPIFDLTDCVQELRRRGIPLPERGPWDTDEIYKTMCAEVIQKNIPLDVN